MVIPISESVWQSLVDQNGIDTNFVTWRLVAKRIICLQGGWSRDILDE